MIYLERIIYQSSSIEFLSIQYNYHSIPYHTIVIYMLYFAQFPFQTVYCGLFTHFKTFLIKFSNNTTTQFLRLVENNAHFTLKFAYNFTWRFKTVRTNNTINGIGIFVFDRIDSNDFLTIDEHNEEWLFTKLLCSKKMQLQQKFIHLYLIANAC